MEIQEVNDLIPIVWENQRVLISKQVAKAYGTTTNVIKENFRRSKEYFEEGVHYFKLTGEELRALKAQFNEFRNSDFVSPVPKMANCLYLWTYEGCVRHCKMLNTPNALEILEELRVNYFEAEPPKVDELLIRTVKGVRCYVDGDMTAHINAEDVARGLGFVEGGKFSTTGENYVRWERVNSYLKEFGYPYEVGKNDFIPENVFYRLAMKANNKVAQGFQAKIADEILPSIRKHGYYASPDSSLATRQIAFDLHSAGQRLVDSSDKMTYAQAANPELARELIAIADKILDDTARDKILIHAANLLVGERLF